MNTLKKCVMLIITFTFVSIFIFSAIQIITYINDSNENAQIADEISENIQEDINEESENNIKYDDKVSVDFASLKAMNSDTVGYLKVNGINIASAVVQAQDNDYYLFHNFNKKYNKAGWIFADFRNRLDGTDNNIIIYGHNMKNGHMFSNLKNILTKEWQEVEENMYVTFVTEREHSIYKVFSVYQIEVENYYITTNFSDGSFRHFVNKMKSRSIKDFNVNVENKNQILTLSTCADDNNYRVVLHAVKC